MTAWEWTAAIASGWCGIAIAAALRVGPFLRASEQAQDGIWDEPERPALRLIAGGRR